MKASPTDSNYESKYLVYFGSTDNSLYEMVESESMRNQDGIGFY